MPVPTDELTRLSTGAPTGYNNDPYNASTNPYGFADGGYITNFFAALNDLTVVSLWVTDEIAPLVDITTEIEALGAIVADLQALAAIVPDVSALAALDTQITALGAITADITTVATNAASVTAVATDIAKVAAVEAALSDIEAVSAALTNISTVVGMAADITTLVARATDIATLADIEDGTEATGAISTVAGIATAVSNVSTNSAAVVAVAGDLSDINTLAGISADVTAAGAVADDIAAVASISADVQTVADNIADVQAAPAAAVAARKSVRHILIDLTSTADSHPGTGKLRFSIDINAASPGATGTVYHDIVDSDGGTSTGWVESFDDVINATGRGNISLVNETDASISLALRVTGAVSNGTGYRKFPFTLLEKSGTIVDEDEFTEVFAANGNDAGGGAGTGDVTSTGSITSGNLVRYADGSGDVIEDAGKALTDLFDKTADDLDDITDGTTYKKYTATEQTKLSGIEAAADVTDAGNVGSAVHGSTGKTTPVDADTMPLIDSAASNVLKKVTWANIKATLKTYLDTLYSAIGHSHAFSAITSKPTTLSGYGITDAQPLDSDLTTIAGLTATTDNFMVANSSAWASRTPAQALVHLGITASAAELNALDGITATVTELNYTDGVTSNIQTQLDGKLDESGGTMTGGLALNYGGGQLGFSISSGNGAITHTGSATSDIQINALNDSGSSGSSAASIRLFRSTNSSGTVSFQVLRGNNSATTDHVIYGNGGYVCGAPSGGNKGVGAINAQAVYDDNTLLTCAAMSDEFRRSGKIDIAFWDSLVPDIEIPELREAVPVTVEVEVARLVDERTADGSLVRKRVTVKEMRELVDLEPVWDDKGRGVDAIAVPVMEEQVTPAHTIKRTHRTARIFAQMIDSGFDPRDPEAYFAKMQADEALPGMPTRGDGPLQWEHNSLSIGELAGQKWLAMEMLAIVCNVMWAKLKDHDIRIAALETARRP